MIIYIGCDHAGLDLKLKVMSAFPNFEWKDQGTFTGDSVDYPDYADKVCKELTKVEILNQKSGITDPTFGPAMGILICGSGQGMAIRANKYQHMRAALCWNEDIAKLSREHNNANILVLSARFTSPDLAIKMVKEFFATKFEGGRHQRRVDKLAADTGC
ncbi:RpiB/LacA/LacB family sugar-phosphate isomerase [Bdellovibrio sp. SKB1291214]|uniref:RpiB/LacA/LacB family sugar-phosphate isomerase n=1 Tax=Bdellovibrio sp. SKB1291214 TaxID=1732569 RepID=UPI000B51B06D|nr:RpiB/LacA/LacB family sugar-phosphate isomerase [Bdellovibrio sp. SKB1291214]UYL08147.1 RpiB/LacA/LacB family sugar-phosphate isomerase [Bdellovibrio sp. SKB1291214]